VAVAEIEPLQREPLERVGVGRRVAVAGAGVCSRTALERLSRTALSNGSLEWLSNGSLENNFHLDEK
jgi:hypothetical protein